MLSASGLGLSFGDVHIFSDVALEVVARARVGVVGPNGSGKTSLMEMVAGVRDPDGGTVVRTQGLRIGFVPQRPSLDHDGTLRDEVMTAFTEIAALEDQVADAALEIQHSSGRDRRRAESRYSALLEKYEAVGGYDYQSSMEKIVAAIGLTPDALSTPVAAASGGQRTRAALATALLSEPDLLILDEPTNYLDFPGLSWLEGFLSASSIAYVVVSHDRYFLDRVTRETWELERGRLQRFKGNYSGYRVQRDEQNARQLAEFERQQSYIQKQEYFIQRYKAGQRTKEARGREKKLARLERIQAPEQNMTAAFSSAGVTRTGQVVLSTSGLQVGFRTLDGEVPLLEVPDVRLERGARTAIVGANGAGKTTLIRTLIGRHPPLHGRASVGHNVVVGYHQQGLDDLPDDQSVIEAFLDIKNIGIGAARNYLARFLFHGEEVFQPVRSLSGGERSRLALARLLISEPNALVLDEPTTHLDIPSREALEEVLDEYEGTLLVASHDRRFISRLTDRLWLVGDGILREFEGNFEEWAASLQDPPPETTRGREPVAPKTVGQALPKRSTSRRREPSRAQAKSRERRRRAAARESERRREEADRNVSELEERVKSLEAKLTRASERRDVDAVTRLGREYEEAQAALERAVEEWAEVAS